MEITHYTLISDVYKFHIDKSVVVFTAHPTPIKGILYAYNQGVLHIIDTIGHDKINIYICSDQVCALSTVDYQC
jgi:hypothetical protein